MQCLVARGFRCKSRSVFRRLDHAALSLTAIEIVGTVIAVRSCEQPPPRRSSDADRSVGRTGSCLRRRGAKGTRRTQSVERRAASSDHSASLCLVRQSDRYCQESDRVTVVRSRTSGRARSSSCRRHEGRRPRIAALRNATAVAIAGITLDIYHVRKLGEWTGGPAAARGEAIVWRRRIEGETAPRPFGASLSPSQGFLLYRRPPDRRRHPLPIQHSHHRLGYVGTTSRGLNR